jgi:hypothetical protein
MRSRWIASSIVVSVALATFLSGAVLAVGRDEAMYVRGTLSAFKARTEGKLNTQSETDLLFNAGKRGSVTIPYRAIASLEFEQVERTVVIIGLAPPVSKRLYYYLTITYRDAENKEQSAVFELGKGVVRPMLTILEARSGKTIAFQDSVTCREYKTPPECQAR